ncbi:MAG: C4-dicarboxylate TRAP transporter substrate-binding protein [Clostridia bacterium]
MLKRVLVGLLCFMLIFATVAGCANNAGNKDNDPNDNAGDNAPAEKIVVKVGYENNPGEPLDIACNRWADLVKERSNGQIEVQLYPSSQLGTKKDLTEQMLMGANVITITDPSFLMDYVPDMGIISGPYLAESYDQLFKLFESDWYKGKVEELEAKGLTIVADNWIYGDRHILANKPVRKAEDLKGLKIRVPNNPIGIKTIEAMGGTPTPMPLGEVYPALAQGVINGAENPLPVLYGAKLYESAKYLSLTEHMNMIIFWIGSAQFFDKIPAESAELIKKAGYDAGVYMGEVNEESDKKAIEDFKAAGVEIIEDVDKETFRNLTKEIYGDFPEWSKGLYDTVQEEMKK